MSANSPFRSLSVQKLQDELRFRKLPIGGTKSVLVARLEEYEGQLNADTASEDDSDRNTSNGTAINPEVAGNAIDARRRELAEQRVGVSIWNSPLVILKYLILYISNSLVLGLQTMIAHVWAVVAMLCLLVAGVAVYHAEGPHQGTVAILESQVLWYGWWLVLGIASSIGLGTGLHTFVLFLGPHIAHVTLTAYQCHNLDFETRGPDSFICEPSVGQAATAAVTVWQIAKKVRLESFFWGLGTSIGELPPYFVARAAAAAGRDDQGFASIEGLVARPKSERTVGERVQVAMYNLMQSLGFFGILLCASIPNPLFDLAGIVCGHFGVPFMTFFGATFLGKAVFKSSIQTISVILMLSEDILAFILAELQSYAPTLHDFVQKLLDEQVKRYQKRPDGVHELKPSKSNYLGALWNSLLVCMIGYFIASLLESLAIAQMKKEHERELQRLQKRALKEHRKQVQTNTDSATKQE
ncbi:hypothetical protein SpCBS45565_g01400 [Spizellomyces sp. 'palustris']|nr:hypothetical protein SpCBS45565_g01400 [Spizellomyces sp. 'palustris']